MQVRSQPVVACIAVLCTATEARSILVNVDSYYLYTDKICSQRQILIE